MAKKLVDRVARGHFIVGRKIYHWDKNDKGKLTAHQGLAKDCPEFVEGVR